MLQELLDPANSPSDLLERIPVLSGKSQLLNEYFSSADQRVDKTFVHGAFTVLSQLKSEVAAFNLDLQESCLSSVVEELSNSLQTGLTSLLSSAKDEMVSQLASVEDAVLDRVDDLQIFRELTKEFDRATDSLDAVKDANVRVTAKLESTAQSLDASSKTVSELAYGVASIQNSLQSLHTAVEATNQNLDEVKGFALEFSQATQSFSDSVEASDQAVRSLGLGIETLSELGRQQADLVVALNEKVVEFRALATTVDALSGTMDSLSAKVATAYSSWVEIASTAAGAQVEADTTARLIHDEVTRVQESVSLVRNFFNTLPLVSSQIESLLNAKDAILEKAEDLSKQINGVAQINTIANVAGGVGTLMSGSAALRQQNSSVL